jgi:hypothetical protein
MIGQNRLIEEQFGIMARQFETIKEGFNHVPLAAELIRKIIHGHGYHEGLLEEHRRKLSTYSDTVAQILDSLKM